MIMAAQKLLVIGESGTGKSTSLRNCDPAVTALVNPVGKALPFKGSAKFETLNNETDSDKIISFMKRQAKEGKKLLVVDDFQYILAVPYMNRIKESGWDKWNDFGANYFDIIEVCKDLPEDVVVAYLSHGETLESGLFTVKLIGKMLREKITIEGLFTVVLRTMVSEGKYYFITQNSGKDTVKSPMGMFPAYSIDNDLAYVADKIRNYNEVGDYKTDAVMQQADAAAAGDLSKPVTRRRGEKAEAAEPDAKPRRTHREAEAANKDKMADYMEKTNAAVAEAAGDREEIPFDEASKAIDTVEKPVLEKVPRRTRKERIEDAAADGTTNTDSETVVLKEDTCFHVIADDNYVKKYAGDTVQLVVGGVKVMEQITEKEFGEGIRKYAQQGQAAEPAMNPPEAAESARPRRTRRTRQ